MLIDFSLNNYLSFADETNFIMVASNTVKECENEIDSGSNVWKKARKMKHLYSVTLIGTLALLLYGCRPTPTCLPEDTAFDYASLNTRARKAYLEPIRPGYEGRNPYWNVFAHKFLYAPAFDFETASGATAYRYTLTQGAHSHTFEAATPNGSLSAVWDSLPVGNTELVVEAIDGDGKVLAEVGRRSFFRDYPFQGPYRPAARNYREAAIKGMLFVHNCPPIRHWLTHNEPDMSFENNTYACKIIGATVRLECLLARECPSVKDEALLIARNAAECLINHSFAEGTPLAFFPPTYYLEPDNKEGWPCHTYNINKGKTMFLEAVMPADAFLDLYDATGEERYLTQTLRIMDTYQRMQNPDGSFPIKVSITDGRIEDKTACSTPTPLLELIQRLGCDYGVHKYDSIISRTEKWVNENVLRTFDLTGQFEDQTMTDLPPYKNLNNCTANAHAVYLLRKTDATPTDIQNAIDLIHMSEDQFVHWDCQPDSIGFTWEATPCVHEQYEYEMPVDDSASGMALSFYELYRRTNDDLCLAKAIALMDAITRVQNTTNGQIPTTWEFVSGQWDSDRTFWPNCTLACAQVLLQFSSEGFGE